MCVILQLSMTVCHIRCTHWLNLLLPEYGLNIWPQRVGVSYHIYTECGGNNYHILNDNKNKTKQGTQKINLFIKSTYYDTFFLTLLKITSLKWRPLLMTHNRSRSRKLSMNLRVIAGGMAATSCRIASYIVQ
jgi:hypothetical protein